MNIDATFWVAVSFFIFFLGLIYLKIPQKVNDVLGNKINETKSELEEAEKLKEEAKNLLSSYENKLTRATDEATNIVDMAKKDSEKNLIDSTEKFYQLIDYKKKSLSEKIDQMKDEAINEIKNTSIQISMEAVEKIIKNSIDKKKLDQFYEENLNQAKTTLKKIIT